MELGWRYPKRKKHILDLLTGKTEKTEGLRFQGVYEFHPIHNVGIGFPKYRLENGRTSAAQEEYLARDAAVPCDFFNRDPEDDAAQTVQHDILKEMIDKEGLHSYFKAAEQEDPLILSNEGFVVNGNRRLCSMRELYESDSTKYARYRNISVVILPAAEDKELDWLEGKEQIQQDIKAEYSWTATAILYRRRMEQHKFTSKDLADLYEKKASEIKEQLSMLEDAETYLSGLGKSGQYHLVDADEFAFKQMGRHGKKIKSVSERELYGHLCYIVIEKNPIGDRVYKTVADIQRDLDDIEDRLRSELGRKRSKSATRAAKKVGLLGDIKDSPSDLLGIVTKRSRHPVVRDIIRDVIEAADMTAKERKGKRFVVSQVRKAAQTLKTAADRSTSKPAGLAKVGVDESLKDIEKQVTRLRGWLSGKP